MLLGLSVSCGATTQHTSAPSTEPDSSAKDSLKRDRDAAQAVAMKAIGALRDRDEPAFRAQLSQELSRTYTRSFYELWVKEVAGGRDHRATGFVYMPGAATASVVVTFYVGRTREKAAVRMAREDGVWRWAER